MIVTVNAASIRRLEPCGTTPNCVCSCDRRPRFHVPPLPLTQPPERALAAILNELRTWRRTVIVDDGPRHVHAVCRSPVFQFADDLELVIDEAQRQVHLRSASRVGRYDFGVNRRRVRRLTRALRGLV
ncbi:MAG: DUF1499 domain-containing protein [Phycisphaeraceae bacterium]